MARVFATGANIGLTIGGVEHNVIATSITLEETLNRVDIQPIAGGDIKVWTNTEANLTLELQQDWNSTGAGTTSLVKALYDAAASAPDTALAFVFSIGATTFSGNVYPEKPSAGGGAKDALTSTVTMAVKGGTVTRA